MNLNEVKAVVTGGASGLGHAVAARIIKAGGKVTIFDVNQVQGTSAAAALGANAAFAQTDVSDEAAVEAAVLKAESAMGGINAAINCAGIATPMRMVGRNGPMPGDFFKRMIGINLVGTFIVAKAASVVMQKNQPNATQERGVIVMTASVAAYDGQIGQTAYSASKGGVVGMTLPMAREMASSGIRVMTIAPGIFSTPMMKAMPQEAQDSLGKQTPFPPRLGDPDEFAALVQHILENVMLNGETIRLDGAIRMAPR
jgi:NAD(P)-dependent dehydrogenase (short-subunit alcohol dehydrogenase family)